MGKIITALERFDEQVLRNRTHPLVGPASQHCSMIRGGSGLSAYAEECSLQVERRTLPGGTPERVMQELREVVRRSDERA
jgi:acetylornithine deacetylase